MNIIADEIYHIYNQGNNREDIFTCDEEYVEFLQLFRKFVLPHCKVLAYCLMPNHFHFEIYATEDSANIKKVGNIFSCQLSNGFRLLQSNYAQWYNKRRGRTGSLFRQKTKAKGMSDGSTNHGYIAFPPKSTQCKPYFETGGLAVLLFPGLCRTKKWKFMR